MRCRVIVSRPIDGKALLLNRGGAWTTPVFAPAAEDPRLAAPINDEMRRQLGFETTILKLAARSAQDGDGGDSEAPRVYFAAARQPNPPTPPNAKWVSESDLPSTPVAPPAAARALAAMFAERRNPPPLAAPWERLGWRGDAERWIRAKLDARGMPAAGPSVQQRVWGISCAMKIPAAAGDVYFKATPPFMAHEGKVMQAVAARCPDLLPPPLAVDAGRGWLLLQDYGSDMLHQTPDISRWEAALRMFARAQARQAQRAREWLRLGCPDRSLGRMAALIDPLIASAAQTLGGKPGALSDAELAALGSLSMPLKLMCARLAQCGVPHSLVHGDLGGNIIVSGGGFAFFDWTDACVSHPFFDMATVSAAYFDESALDASESTAARLRNAYLEPWTEFAPMERLIDAHEESLPLGALHQAMTYMWIRSNIAADARPEFDMGLAHWLRRLLRLCGAS